jgi:hypothetical protein
MQLLEKKTKELFNHTKLIFDDAMIFSHREKL